MSVMNRLLEMQEQRMVEGLSDLEEVRLSQSEIEELEEEYLQHCCPRNPREPKKVLGMKIIRV